LNQPYEFSLFSGVVRFALAQLALCYSFPLLGAAYPPADITVALCYTFFLWSQDELAASALFFDNTSFVASPLKLKSKH
jgi:hypothetical protein